MFCRTTVYVLSYFCQKISKAIVSPAPCTPIAPSPPIPFAANAAATAWSLLLHDVIGDRMIPFAANALQCTVNGKKTSKTASSPLDFITLPEEDRATAIGNTHRKKLVKISRVIPEICPRTDRHTHAETDTQTYSSQYFANYLYFVIIWGWLRV